MLTSIRAAGHWSGNYLNWVLNVTDHRPFARKTLTGGARIVDTSSATILQKAYQDSQSGSQNQNSKSISGTTVTGATPLKLGQCLYLEPQYGP